MKLKIFIFLLSIVLNNCVRNNARLEFESGLNYFIGKPSSEVLKIFGKENITFSNKGITPTGIQLTNMNYEEKYSIAGQEYACFLVFHMEQGKDFVIDWDYNGNGCF